MQTLIFTLIGLGLLITFHEYGHYLAARLCGVHVIRFSIGFGPALIRWKNRRGTIFCIALLPFGGFVQMLESRFSTNLAQQYPQYTFDLKPLWQRASIVAAGPLANVLLAILLNIIILITGVQYAVPRMGAAPINSPAAFANIPEGSIISAVDDKPVESWRDVSTQLLNRLGHSGEIILDTRTLEETVTQRYYLPIENWLSDAVEVDPLSALGIQPWLPPLPAIIDTVQAGAAMRAGLQSGDRIVAVNGNAITNWNMWVEVVRANPQRTMLVSIKRGDTTLILPLTPDTRTLEDGGSIGFVGVSAQVPDYPPELLRTKRAAPLAALWLSVEQTVDMTQTVAVGLWKMVTGQISIRNLGGPITIVQAMGNSAQSGIITYLTLLAYLSLSLALLNLLPIPVLDGGHLLFYGIEALRRRPLPDAVQRMGMRIGLFLLSALMFIAIFNDLMRL